MKSLSKIIMTVITPIAALVVIGVGFRVFYEAVYFGFTLGGLV